ncbi:CD276 antigen-like [Chrysemys picta bellii]|uniref:CD276 antigen-like n=1 Tax=Chrysemys picta bellii TaxID=8478 RepID=UPI0032B13AF7
MPGLEEGEKKGAWLRTLPLPVSKQSQEGKSESLRRVMCPGLCSPIFLFLVWGTHWGLITAESPVTAQFGRDVTLSCLFPSQPGMNLQHLTLTWQKEQVGAEALVVHSHYYGREQLARQDEAYRNRTWLDPEGLARGNASLMLMGVRTQDEGVYRCHVTSELGTTSETRQVTVMAPYSEPHLTLDLSFRLGHTLLTFSSGGGYPRASVEWRDGTGTNLTELSTTTESVDAWGLYTLCSELAVPVGRSTNLTVLLVTAPGRETHMQHITVAGGPGQRWSHVWLLVACLGAVILSVIVAVGILHSPGRATCRRCSESRFTGTKDVEDPSPQIGWSTPNPHGGGGLLCQSVSALLLQGKSESLRRVMCPGLCSPISLFLVWGAHWGLITAESPVTAQFGRDVTLSCLFPSQPGMNLQHLTVTWQKERAGAEILVVHSHYYGKEQLERQDEAYRNRTQLDPEGLARGNASLTLMGVRTQDEGIYRCHVTSELGTTSETRQVTVIAPYSEPHLTLDLSFRLGHTLLTFSSGGGYPRASVEWRDGMGTNLTELSSTTESVDAWGLYTLCSELAVPVGQSTNLTVLLVTAPGRETHMQHITVAGEPGQRRSHVWLLVACLGAVFLSVILAVWILRPPSRGTCRRCSESRFAGTRDVEDPSPQIQPGPRACPALGTPTLGLGADLPAAPSLSRQGSVAGSQGSLESMAALHSKGSAVLRAAQSHCTRACFCP